MQVSAFAKVCVTGLLQHFTEYVLTFDIRALFESLSAPQTVSGKIISQDQWCKYSSTAVCVQQCECVMKLY